LEEMAGCVMSNMSRNLLSRKRYTNGKSWAVQFRAIAGRAGGGPEVAGLRRVMAMGCLSTPFLAVCIVETS